MAGTKVTSASTTTSTAYPPTASRSRDRIGGDAGAGSGTGGAAAMLREYGGSGRRAEAPGRFLPREEAPGPARTGAWIPWTSCPMPPAPSA